MSCPVCDAPYPLGCEFCPAVQPKTPPPIIDRDPGDEDEHPKTKLIRTVNAMIGSCLVVGMRPKK